MRSPTNAEIKIVERAWMAVCAMGISGSPLTVEKLPPEEPEVSGPLTV